MGLLVWLGVKVRRKAGALLFGSGSALLPSMFLRVFCPQPPGTPSPSQVQVKPSGEERGCRRQCWVTSVCSSFCSAERQILAARGGNGRVGVQSQDHGSSQAQLGAPPIPFSRLWLFPKAGGSPAMSHTSPDAQALAAGPADVHLPQEKPWSRPPPPPPPGLNILRSGWSEDLAWAEPHLCKRQHVIASVPALGRI